MLNIYPHYTYHDDVEFVGELEDLIKLRDSLTDIINGGSKNGHFGGYIEGFFASDGEWYNIIVKIKTEEEMMKLEPEYTLHH